MEQGKNNRENREMVKEEENTETTEYPIHSQVMKIKREEFEKVKYPSLEQPPDMRRLALLHHQVSRQRSRSPLGLAERPISVGN